MKRSTFAILLVGVLLIACGSALQVASVVDRHATPTTTTSVAPRTTVLVPTVELLDNLALCVHSTAIECHVDVVGGKLVAFGTYPTIDGLKTLRVHCQEDDPCWDCKTMGNHICGRARP